jgi:hypothetical protein
MFKSFQYPISGVPFERAWNELVRDYNIRRTDLIFPECSSCRMSLICSNCPAWSEIETGALNKKVEYICEYARCLEEKYFKQKEGSEHGEKTLSKT